MVARSSGRNAYYRILAIPFIAVLIFAATRALVRALPGDPIDTLIAETGTTIPAQRLAEELGLNIPYWKAMPRDLSRALHGDLGVSLISRQPITPTLIARSKKTMELAVLALLMASAISLTAGLLAADPRSRLRSGADHFCSIYGTLAAAMPTPWTGPLLMAVFCVWIPLLPTGNHVLLPAITLALSFSGFWARLVRERVRESMTADSTRAARARGLSEWKITFKYGLAPVSGALLAYLGTQAGNLMAGAFITETVFDWRGLGSLLVEAVLKRDYPVVEGATFLTALFCLLGTAVGDWLQNSVDPRLGR